MYNEAADDAPRPTCRLLVVANETAPSDALRDAIDLQATDAEVLVVAPALSTRLAFWLSDDRRFHDAAERRLEFCLAGLRAVGTACDGYVGDADPLLAIEDALRRVDADAIIVSTHPEDRSNWLAHDVVDRARRRFDPPVHHLVVDEVRELVAA